jgi:hypothetical protein
MIQLATDPNASRNWRPAAAEAKEATLAGNRRPRSGHAWPFISRYAERASTPQEPKRTPSDSGS